MRLGTTSKLVLLSLAASVSADCDEPLGFVSVAGYNHCAYTTSPKSLPPARPSRAKMVDIVLSFVVLCRSRKDRHPSLEHLCVRLLTRLSACLLALRKTERTMLTHRPFCLPPSRAVEYSHASAVSMIAASSPARRCCRVYTNGKTGRAETALPALRLSRILSVNLYRQDTSEVPLSYLCGEDFKAPRRFRAQSSNPASSAAPSKFQGML